MKNPFSAIWNCFKYDNKDITYWTKLASSRGPTTIVVSLYSSTALLFLADNLDKECTGQVHLGFLTLQTASVLSFTQVVENIVNAFLAPIFGAVADAKSNRKGLLVFSSAVWVSMMGVGGAIIAISISSPSALMLWLFILSLIFVAVFYELALFLTFAYLPEVVESDQQLKAVTSKQYAIVNGLQLFVAAALVGLSLFLPKSFLGQDELPLSVIAHESVVLVWLWLGLPGLYGIPTRTKEKTDDAATKRSNGSWKQLKNTFVEIKQKYPQVGWFLLAWTFYFAGIASVTVLQVAYLQDQLFLSTSEIGYAGAVLLFFSVVGAIVVQRVMKVVKLKNLLFGTIFLWCIAAASAPFVMTTESFVPDGNSTEDGTKSNGCPIDSEEATRRPTDLANIMIWGYSMIFGLGIGFVYPVNVSIYALIIPGGEEASFFGVKTFCSKVFTWAPPLIFTLINESTKNLQFSFLSLTVWFAVSLPFIYMMDVDQGIKDVASTLKLRHGAGKNLQVGAFDKEEEVGFGAVNVASAVVAETVDDEEIEELKAVNVEEEKKAVNDKDVEGAEDAELEEGGINSADVEKISASSKPLEVEGEKLNDVKGVVAKEDNNLDKDTDVGEEVPMMDNKVDSENDVAPSV